MRAFENINIYVELKRRRENILHKFIIYMYNDELTETLAGCPISIYKK